MDLIEYNIIDVNGNDYLYYTDENQESLVIIEFEECVCLDPELRRLYGGGGYISDKKRVFEQFKEGATNGISLRGKDVHYFNKDIEDENGGWYKLIA